MTLRGFIEALKKAGVKLRLTKWGTIRATSNFCPIEALARKKRLRYHLGADSVWRAAHVLGLNRKTAQVIICAADDTFPMKGASALAVKRARRLLLGGGE